MFQEQPRETPDPMTWTSRLRIGSPGLISNPLHTDSKERSTSNEITISNYTSLALHLPFMAMSSVLGWAGVGIFTRAMQLGIAKEPLSKSE